MQESAVIPGISIAAPLSALDRGKMDQLIADRDWSKTGLGSVETWSDALKLSVQIILASGFPMAVRWGPDLITIYNDAYAAILGDKHPHALGRPTVEVWPEIYDELGPLSESILRGERGSFFEKNYRWKLWRRGALEDAFFTISYSPIPDAEARHGIGGVLVTAVETTDEVYAERRLSKLTEHLEKEVARHVHERDRIWHVSEDLLGVSNFEGYFESVNPAWTRLLGWTADEIRRMNVSELRHPDDASDSEAQRDRLRSGVPTVRMENRFRHKDGSWRWLHWTLTAERGLIYVIGRHITSEKEAAKGFHESEQLFRLLVNAVTDYALYKLTPEGIVSSWNIGAQRIKGYSADEIIGRHFSCFYTADDRRAGAPESALRKAASEGRYETEAWRVRKDGKNFWANVVIDAIYGDDGSLIGFVKITRDITERREAQIALQLAQEQLAQAQKMDALGQLTGGIAHDFNNMLMVLGGYTQFLKSRLEDPKDRRAVEAIEFAATRAENLTRQLLSFSRRRSISPKTVNLADALKRFKDVLTATISGKIRLEIDVPAELWPVTIDLNEFEVAMINLLVNARDAMPSGGGVRVSGRNTAVDVAKKLVHLEGEFVAIEIKDDGVGIPRDVLPKVFDPFFTTKEADKGTGLGLSQVYGFAQQAGGMATIASEVGHGTTVTLYLPRARQDARDAPADDSNQALPRGNELVLLVEDNAEVQSVASAMLEQLGYRTITADSADKAIAVLNSGQSIDLVLTDVVMPGALDGLALARQLKQNHRQLPILLTTGYSKTVTDSFTEFPVLRKPYQLPTLARAVRRAIDGTDSA